MPRRRVHLCIQTLELSPRLQPLPEQTEHPSVQDHQKHGAYESEAAYMASLLKSLSSNDSIYSTESNVSAVIEFHLNQEPGQISIGEQDIGLVSPAQDEECRAANLMNKLK